MSIESAQAYMFNSNELLTLGIAAYAAIISTFVLGWDAYKWLASGAKINITASAGMKVIGGVVEDPKTYVLVTAYNVGDRPTTITNLGGMYFKSWWRAYFRRRKPCEAFIITQPSETQQIPYRFEIGDQWMGMADQTEDLAQKAEKGYLYLILYTSAGGSGHWVRVKINSKNIEE